MVKLFNKKVFKRIFIAIFAVLLSLGLFFVISNFFIICNGKKAIVPMEELKQKDFDCILILGAGVWSGNRPSHMLADRLDEGIRLYHEGVAPKILVSGDHGSEYYDEVNVMKKYLMDAGIPDEDIFMDHAGFSTYESMYRAKEIFGVESMVIVTQEYHMYRAVYIAEQMKMEVCGSPSDPRTYRGTFSRGVREWIARDKDIFTCLFKVKPAYLGEKVDIHGNGMQTNDK